MAWTACWPKGRAHGVGGGVRRPHPLIQGQSPWVTRSQPAVYKALPAPGLRVPPAGFSGQNNAAPAATRESLKQGPRSRCPGSCPGCSRPSARLAHGWAALQSSTTGETISHHPEPRPREAQREAAQGQLGWATPPSSHGGLARRKDPDRNSQARTEVGTPEGSSH